MFRLTALKLRRSLTAADAMKDAPNLYLITCRSNCTIFASIQRKSGVERGTGTRFRPRISLHRIGGTSRRWNDTSPARDGTKDVDSRFTLKLGKMLAPVAIKKLQNPGSLPTISCPAALNTLIACSNLSRFINTKSVSNVATAKIGMLASASG